MRPYYLLQADPVRGTGHLRTPLATGIAIMERLQGRLSGIALPKLIVDTPGGMGKVPSGPTTSCARPARRTLFRTHRGVEVDYLDPPESSALTDLTERKTMQIWRIAARSLDSSPASPPTSSPRRDPQDLALIRDVSTSGARLYTRGKLELDETVTLHLYLGTETDEPRKASGRVVRVDRRIEGIGHGHLCRRATLVQVRLALPRMDGLGTGRLAWPIFRPGRASTLP